MDSNQRANSEYEHNKKANVKTGSTGISGRKELSQNEEILIALRQYKANLCFQKSEETLKLNERLFDLPHIPVIPPQKPEIKYQLGKYATFVTDEDYGKYQKLMKKKKSKKSRK